MTGQSKFLAVSGFCLFSLLFSLCYASCASGAVSAEEYFSIGMAYYDLGKYSEARQWLTKAAQADRTMTASEYNLGRIAFETGNYAEASTYFENILKKDPNNILALKAAAYTRIRTGDFQLAETLYERVLALVPESSDDGYNYAIVLFAIGKFRNCETVLLRYPFAIDENPDALLLLARAQAAENKVEAADNYAKWIAANSADNPLVLYEYGNVLEKAELYALALEQYRQGLLAMNDDLPGLKRNQLRFNIARLLLIADPGNNEGITELQAAMDEGFTDMEAVRNLLNDSRVNEVQKIRINELLSNSG